MKRVSIACFALAVLVAAAAVFSPLHAAETSKEGSLSVLKAWVGEHSFMKKDGRIMWDVEPLQRKLEKVLGEKKYKAFKYHLLENGRSTPVEQEDNLINVFLCKKGDCMGFLAIVFVNLSDDKVSVCWKDSAQKNDLFLSEDGEVKKIDYAACAYPDRTRIFKENSLKK